MEFLSISVGHTMLTDCRCNSQNNFTIIAGRERNVLEIPLQNIPLFKSIPTAAILILDNLDKNKTWSNPQVTRYNSFDPLSTPWGNHWIQETLQITEYAQ